MSWLTRLILGKPRDLAGMELVIDLRQQTFCGIGRGDTREAIEARLGPPDSVWKRRKGLLDYRRIGLFMTLDERLRADGFFLDFEHGPDASIYRWHPHGNPPTERQILQQLGAPTHRHHEDDAIELEWSRDSDDCGFDFSHDGRLIGAYFVWD